MLGWAQESQLWTSPCPRWYFNAFCSLGLLSRRKMCLHSLIHPTLIMHLGGRPWAGCFSSVQFSLSVVFNSLQAHRLQHARPLCPSPTPGVHSNSHPNSQQKCPKCSTWVQYKKITEWSLFVSKSNPHVHQMWNILLSSKTFAKKRAVIPFT